jgi:hypothetical protein
VPSDRSFESLLQPTLAAAAPAEPLYSVRANVLVAFFGGVYAAALFCALNARRMRRLKHDAWVCILVAVVWSFVLFSAGRAIATDSVPAWLEIFPGKPSANARHLGRVAALALFGALYLRRRVQFKAQALAGIDAPNPWPAALVSIAVSLALSGVVFVVALAFGRE